MSNVADAIVKRLAQHGVKRIWGVPGGDCSLDILDAAARHGIHYVLTRTESGAAMMAMADAQVTGAPGVLLTTRGPGLTNGTNGIACASLDRVPLLVLADGHETDMGHVSHQRYDQMALMAPLVKASSVLESGDPVAELDRLMASAMAGPAGPVYLEMVGQRLRAPFTAVDRPLPAPPRPPAPEEAALAAARAVLGKARRPIIIAGLQARDEAAAAGLRWLASQWEAPVLATCMGKGALSDTHEWALGPFISGAAEDTMLRQADCILLYGADPIEFMPKPWAYASTPVVELTAHTHARPYLTPQAQVVGDLSEAAMALEDAVAPGHWAPEQVADARETMRALARTTSSGIAPHQVVEAAMQAAPDGTRVTVDAGAHILPAVALWPARQALDFFITRGLATMAYALPNAIGAALADPSKPVLAFTGDGGLMMGAGELGTAVQEGANVKVVVFNDASIALIEVKQRRRQFPLHGMRYPATDFAAVARGFGCAALRVESLDQLVPALREAFATPGPVLLDVAVDGQAYHSLVPALRG